MKCSKHPHYKAIFRPRVKCWECLMMYLNKLERTYALVKLHKKDCECDRCD